jgi:tripartite-type tricarboxylate transporter receptor subunit TctC
MVRRSFLYTLSVTAALFAFSAPSASQSFPTRPLRMIVPFAPGGVADIVARIVGQKMGDIMGQTVVIDNRPGAGGSLAGEIVAKARTDGYTMLLCSSSVMVINPLLSPNLQYDPQRVLAPVSLLSAAPYVLLVHPSSPYQSVRDLLAAAKAKPGALNYGTAGVGSASHLVSELFRSMAGIQVVHVPYKGTALASNDLLSGQLQMMFDSISAALPNIRAGRLRALGIATRKPSPLAPDIVPIGDDGVPGFEGTTWQGLCAPAATPTPILTQLNDAAVRSVQSPEIRTRFASLGVEGVGSGSDEFRAYIKAELARWEKTIREAGIKAD